MQILKWVSVQTYKANTLHPGFKSNKCEIFFVALCPPKIMRQMYKTNHHLSIWALIYMLQIKIHHNLLSLQNDEKKGNYK